MLLYADEDFPYPTVVELRRLGHDVLTAQQDGQSAAPDAHILACAHSLGRDHADQRAFAMTEHC